MHTVNAQLSVSAPNFDVRGFVEAYQVATTLLWVQGENEPWSTVNTKSGFQTKIYHGPSNKFAEDSLEEFLSKAIWLSQLTSGTSIRLSIEVVVDNDLSFSPSFEVPATVLQQLASAGITLEVTSCGKLQG